MTVDDQLLLSDLDRIGEMIGECFNALDEFNAWESPAERIKIPAPEVDRMTRNARTAAREIVTLRERLEKRLKG